MTIMPCEVMIDGTSTRDEPTFDHNQQFVSFDKLMID